MPAVSADLLNFVAYFGLVLGAVEEGFASSHCSAAAAVGTAAVGTAAPAVGTAASFHCTAHCAAAAAAGAERPASQTEFLWSACPQLP